MDVVVLSGDLSLFEAIRHAVGERNPVWRARSAGESVELLLTGRCGVLLIDMAAVSTQPATLVEQIVAQFPDVVVVVAGRRADLQDRKEMERCRCRIARSSRWPSGGWWGRKDASACA